MRVPHLSEAPASQGPGRISGVEGVASRGKTLGSCRAKLCLCVSVCVCVCAAHGSIETFATYAKLSSVAMEIVDSFCGTSDNAPKFDDPMQNETESELGPCHICGLTCEEPELS